MKLLVIIILCGYFSQNTLAAGGGTAYRAVLDYPWQPLECRTGGEIVMSSGDHISEIDDSCTSENERKYFQWSKATGCKWNWKTRSTICHSRKSPSENVQSNLITSGPFAGCEHDPYMYKVYYCNGHVVTDY